MKSCPRCSMPIRRRARYCSRCGRGVPFPAVVRLALAAYLGFFGLVVAMLIVAAVRDCGR